MSDRLLICICTFRRPVFLERCLKSWRRYAAEYPVLIVDNAGQTDCRTLCEQYGVRYVHATKVGLSHARNTGWEMASNLPPVEWICYLDDDAILRPNTISRLAAYLDDETLVGLGGRFEHYYEYPPPRWLEIANGKGMAPVPGVDEPTRLKPGQKLFGGIMALRLTAIEQVGGFDPQLGMQGEKFGYGEESELIFRLQKHGQSLLYDPDIVIDHLYSPRKYTVRAHLEMSFQQGKADRHKGLPGPASWRALLLLWIKLICFTMPFTLARWGLRHREWQWQNAFLVVASKFTDSWGYFSAQ